ncbi:MAG: DUF2914 domain-containing protein [bacterium]|nr:DUF2914 domain-containing protein [bacterium]
MFISPVFARAKRWYARYERFLIPGALLFGIIADTITFRFINLSLAFSILFTHLLLSLLAITFMHAHDTLWAGYEQKTLRFIRLFAPLLLQFTFGALLSGFLIFYGFAGSFSVSWPFLLLIIFLMVSNDLLKKYYLLFIVHLSVFFFSLLSYAILVIPTILKQMGTSVFLLSSLLSSLFMFAYLFALSSFIPNIRTSRRALTVSFLSIISIMNLFYFTNIIPPIPLSLREIGVYHSVSRESESGTYHLLAEELSLIDRLRFYPPIHKVGEVIVFTSVFAPADLKTTIIHHWQYYNASEKTWISAGNISFPMTGGRINGYRGYSKKTVLPGLWRVDIENPRGQVMGRIRFHVKEVQNPLQLRTEWK